eukprot:TRINITY_DN17112_c0_g1_i1.p1 TRINITY_DN17112_c0_g1~~TRINITY_DN17112_c0_g1_i1.p1  ORF type:complete len:530 (+),score=240.35 TRINITY_DN17112_c0_g1_i1:62-1591(+)
MPVTPRTRRTDSAHRPRPRSPRSIGLPWAGGRPVDGAVSTAVVPTSGNDLAGLSADVSDAYLNESCRGRLAALMDLRVKIEALAAQHREEEQSFVFAMRELLRHATDEKQSQQSHVRELQDKLNHYEGLLLSEEREKSKAVEMVSVFKQEGGQIMSRLRESLASSNKRCEEEKRRADRLEAEREQQQRREQQLEAQLSDYQSLLSDHERLVTQLRERNGQLELQLRHAEQLLTDLSAEDVFNQHYQEMIVELKGVDRTLASPRTPVSGQPAADHALEAGGDAVADGSGQPLQRKLLLQGQIIQKLYSKLQSEQRHRLETEEQAAKMVAEEENTIRKLEERVKDLERTQGPNTPRPGAAGNETPPAPRRAVTLPSAALAAADLGPDFSSPVASPPAPSSVSVPPGSDPDSAQWPRQQPDGRAMPHSLQAKLAEVTRDFNDSLEMLNTRLAGHAGRSAPPGSAKAADVGSPDDLDFLPDSPAVVLDADDAEFLPSAEQMSPGVPHIRLADL